MKYFGKKSLSSFLSGFLHVSWYIVLLLSIFGAVFGIIMIYMSLGDHVSEFAKCYVTIFEMNGKDKEDWETFKTLPGAVKFLIMPYFAVVVVFLLKIIKKSEHLFINFKNDIVFNRSNVLIISAISKLNIILSILTFSFSSLLISIFLFMLCEIIKNGTALQEEHDYTV
jgi:hypothetical protein